MSIQLEEAPAMVAVAPEQDVEEEMLEAVHVEPSRRSAPRKRINLRRLIVPIGGVVLVLGAVIGFNMYRDGQMYVSTDNAQLTGTPVQVGAMNAGRVQSIAPRVGDTVHKGDALAVVELPSQVGTAQNGQAKLDFLPSGDSTVTVQSPFDGVVLSVPATPGQTVQAGQGLVTIVDPTQLWVNANIEETNVERCVWLVWNCYIRDAAAVAPDVSCRYPGPERDPIKYHAPADAWSDPAMGPPEWWERRAGAGTRRADGHATAVSDRRGTSL